MIASGIFIAAGWRSKPTPAMASARGMPDGLWNEAELDLSATQPRTDVSAAIRLALKRLTPMLLSQSVHAEIATPPDLSVRMRGAALTDMLEELLAAAIVGAPTSHLLLTATRHGDGIYVGITDDMPSADIAVRMGSLRGLMQRVAMRGCTLNINVRHNEDATMSLRLPAATEHGKQPRGESAPDLMAAPIPSMVLPDTQLR